MTSTQIRKPARLLSLLAAAVAPALGLFGALGVAPAAQATATDDAFLAALKAKGINYESSDAAVTSGHLVCKELDSGESPEQVANDIINTSKLDSYHAGFFVGASIKAYCPKYVASASG